MRAETASEYRCPLSGDALTLEGETLRCEGCGEVYAIEDGIPDFVVPRELRENEEMMKEEFDRRAGSYDSDLEWQYEVFDEDMDEVHKRMVDLLELKPGMRVLETGAGTGTDSVHILAEIGADGRLHAQDLSRPMLEEARRKLAGDEDRFELHVGNGSYLPFPDDSFDAAYHFGALNFFDEKQRALEEMTRVVRPGGKVVAGDEGMAPWLRERRHGKAMIATNKNYRFEAPVDMLPVEAREVAVRWLLGDSFYVMDWRVGEGEVPLDYDLPLPGKSDTVRSRYEGSKAKG